MNENDKPKFYAHGKYFDNEDEFWKFCLDWPFEKINEDSFNYIMNTFSKNIKLNMDMYGSHTTNGAFNDLMHETLMNCLGYILPSGK